MSVGKLKQSLICLCLCSAIIVISADEACDKSKCKGPVKYYEDLNCIPIYDGEDTCCAVKYNCDHLKGRSKDKCYYKGHVYEIGDKLREEDAEPCDIGCVCSAGWSEAGASFTCAVVDCFNRPKPGCYLKTSANQCCPGPEVCSTDVARCEVDGKTYFDGQQFTPNSDPKLSCTCSAGYRGENVAPFCYVPKPFSCNVELRNSYEIYFNCTPTFYNSQNAAVDCSYASRCQNNNDTVVKNERARNPAEKSDPSLSCIFGNLTMNVGDELNSGTDYSSVCMKCVCEVPPLPTCKRLPDNECDVTKHAPFDSLYQ